MKRSLSGSLVVLLATLSVTCNAQDTPASPPAPAVPQKSEKELRAILQSKCDEVNQFYKAEGFPVLVPSVDFSDFKYETDTRFNIERGNRRLDVDRVIGSFRTSGGKVGPWADILADSGNFTLFSNSSSEIKAEDGEPQQFKTLTNEDTIEYATKFADLFTKSWNKHLGKPEINRDPQGNCQVTWKEQSASGIPYTSGFVKVELSGKYGPYEIQIDLSTFTYGDKPIKKISPDNALSRANKELQKVVTSDPNTTDLHGALTGEHTTISLMIVPGLDGTGRLAYVVTYPFTTSSPYLRGNIGISIDAENGRLLGISRPLMKG